MPLRLLSSLTLTICQEWPNLLPSFARPKPLPCYRMSGFARRPMRRILTLISVFVVALSLFTIIRYSSSGVQSQSPDQAQRSTAAAAQHTNTDQKPVPEPATGTNAQDAEPAPAYS